MDEKISIPDDELAFTPSRSTGPVGWNVNKISSEVTLWFDVVNSPSLSPEDKELIMTRLVNLTGKDGVLRVVSQQIRSPAANKELATARLADLLRLTIRQVQARKKTGVTKAAKLCRMEEKKQHSMVKHERSNGVPIED